MGSLLYGKKGNMKNCVVCCIVAVCVLLTGIPTPLLAESVVVYDQAGRSVVIQQPVERVVTTFIPATLFALCAGLKDRIVGASTKDGTSSIYEALIDKNNPPTLVGNRSNGLNLETIASLKPDLVIMYGQKDGVRLADRLTALGIPVIVIMPEDFSSMKTALALIGEASGRRKHVDTVIAAMSAIEKGVASRVEGLAAPRVYYATSNLLRTVSGDMLQNEMIRLAGGKNVSEHSKGFFVNISREQLFTWNPEIILCSDRLSSAELERIYSPEFSSLAALQDPANTKVFRFPAETYWDFPSPLAMAGVLWMSKQIHPEAYNTVDFQKEIDWFYDSIFGQGFAQSHPVVVGRQP
ncbi:ABC transporter substrate-binding protein [Desulfocapsa sp. AH-315-G09]|nr:ABC transporter substrate-binding protein [Desulfocapsa sp. AH-315-G09]